MFRGMSAGIDSMGMDVYSYDDDHEEGKACEAYGMDDLEYVLI